MSDEHFLDALDLSDDAKDALRAIKAEVEGAYKDRIRELEAHNARLREGGRLWAVDRSEVATQLDTPSGAKHIVAALFDYAERKKVDEFEGHIFAIHAATYIQWLEDELHRYQGVPDEMYDDWDEQEVREQSEWSEANAQVGGEVLVEDLKLTLKVLDANRVWKVKAERETSRLGQWNLELRAAIHHLLETNDGRPLGVSEIKRLQAALAAKSVYEDTAKVAEVLKRLNKVLDAIRGEDGGRHSTLLEIDSLVESCLPLLAVALDPKPSDLRERLAALKHDQWADWTDHMLDRLHVLVPLAYGHEHALQALQDIAQWRQQVQTPYAKLTETEKDSYREWADKTLLVGTP